MNSRRRPDLGRSPERDSALLRQSFLRYYDRDSAFCSALLGLYERTVASAPPPNPGFLEWTRASRHDPEVGGRPLRDWTPFPWGSDAERGYLAELVDFAAKWGLDRLEGDPATDVPDGVGHVNAWCVLRQLRPEATPPSEFSSATGWIEPFVNYDPTVKVELHDYWLPTHERMQDAQRRLEQLASEAIRARLQSIASDAELNGLSFPATTPARERHLGWVFQLCRYRKTIVQIAGELQESEPEGSEARDWEDTVSKAVSRMARRLRVRADGWYVTGRTSRPDR